VKFELGELGPDGSEGHSGISVVVVERTPFGSDGNDKGALNSLSFCALSSFSIKSYTHTRAPSCSFPTDPSFFGLDELLTPSLLSCHSLTRALSLSPLAQSPPTLPPIKRRLLRLVLPIDDLRF
jgi:hypothetical protein